MNRLMPKFLTEQVAQEAVTLVLSEVMSPSTRFPVKRRHCHVVILVPSMEDGRKENYPKWPNYALEPALLYEDSYGNPDEWEHPYDEVARCKALQLWHDRSDGRTDVMPLSFPVTLLTGEGSGGTALW